MGWSWAYLANLTFLDLTDNQLSGEIPAELGSLPNLQSLWLQGNQLSGEMLRSGVGPDLQNCDFQPSGLPSVPLPQPGDRRGDTAGVGQPRQPDFFRPHR